MHEAYQVSSLLNLTHQVESITAYDDNLLVGTRQGHLFMYNLVKNDDKAVLQLMRYNKSFSKKAVQQLKVIPDHNVLISLTDNLIQVHDLNSTNFNTIHTVHKSRGATFFAINIKKDVSLTGRTSVLARMAVVVKRKIQFYYWKNTEFLTYVDDINLSDIPRSIVWCQEAICVGYRGDYALLELNGKKTDLFPTSSTRSNEPCMVKVSESTFALCRESQTVLVNVKGETERNKALKWSQVPVTLAWDEPYALGVLTDSIEVLTLVEPGGLIQTLPDLAKVRFIVAAKPGILFAASVSQVWCIQAVDVAKQKEVLVSAKQFHLALKLTELSDESEDEKKEKIHHIQTLLAYDLFARKQFHESMKEFLKLGTDAYDVIRLFPDLLPQQQQQGTDLPEPTRDLTEKELETSRLALIDYLTEMRRQLSPESQASLNARGNLNDRATSKSTNQLLQIIDTTLLKCYLQTNDALVAPLLRLNHCHLVETEKVLKKMGKHNELIILYQTKGQHRRALELLQSEGRSVERTIWYLQRLGSENMGLIIEFADWVLTDAPEEGLKIFTEDIAEVEALPRPRVLDFLLKSHKSVVIPYLEHVVHVWEDTNPLFHNALVHQYREKIINEGPAQAEHTRKKLLQFLEKSTQYTAENILSNFPTDGLLEERALILGRLGKHEQAIALYVRALGDVPKAVEYCRKVYEKGVLGSQSVYVSLIKIILDPNSCLLTLPGLTLSPKTAQPDLELALQLLEENASRMNPLEALAILPDSVPISRIRTFLLVALQKFVQERRTVQLLKGLLYAEHLQCQEMKLALQGQHVLVTELNVCPVCKKRFGNQSALVRYPNGDVVHYSCQEKK